MSEEMQLVEWKQSWRDEWLQWIAGYANAQGEVLEVGRADNGEVVGLADEGILAAGQGVAALGKPAIEGVEQQHRQAHGGIEADPLAGDGQARE